MPRAEFSVATKKAARARAQANGNLCECGCGRPLEDPSDAKSRPEYDHDIEAELGGDNSLENCRCIRLDCHRSKTSKRAPVLAKIRREDMRKKGIKARKRKIPGRRFNGDPIWPD